MNRHLPRRMFLASLTAGAGAMLHEAIAPRMASATGYPRDVAGPEEGSNSPDTQTEGVQVTPRTNKELWTPWLELWNGNLAVADEIIAPDFVAHFAAVGGSPAEVRGPAGLQGWIGGVVAAFEKYEFTTTVGPLADGDLVAGRWIFRATYRGGIPGSSPEAVGKEVAYAGIDIFRVEAGKLVEYWLCADVLDMLQQIGVIPT